MATKLETYRADARSCQKLFHEWIEPAVQVACEAVKHDMLPKSFPKRDPKDDMARGITSQPPEILKRKRKPRSRAQKALAAMNEELAEPLVLLPSAYHSKIREHTDMTKAVETELALRQGQADEALDDLRLHIATYESLEQRKKEGSGVRHNTTMDRRLDNKRAAQHRARDRYRAVRDIMLILGMSQDDPKFKELRDSDLKAFTLTLVEQRLGDSYRLPSWIWGDFSFVNQVKKGEMRTFLEASKQTTYQCCRHANLDAGMRVHWFRHHSLVLRWTEELKTRREEIYRCAEFFASYEQEWLIRATGHEHEGKQGAAAYARR